MKKFRHDKIKNGRLAATVDRQIFSLTRFTQHFFMFCSKIYIIYPSLARMSSKLGKIRTETRSWRPKWPIIAHYFFNMRNICQTGPLSKIFVYHISISLIARMKLIPFIRFTKIRRPSITPLN